MGFIPDNDWDDDENFEEQRKMKKKDNHPRRDRDDTSDWEKDRGDS